jgi:hypothetical protein
MSLSLLLLASGLLLEVLGGFLLVGMRHRRVAVACLIVGTVLIVAPPLLVVITSM